MNVRCICSRGLIADEDRAGDAIRMWLRWCRIMGCGLASKFIQFEVDLIFLVKI
jgi:hypothetical protein